MSIDLLKDLNDVQRKAVECTVGPVIIIAGAGSGKTRALTYRVAYLLKNGVNPFNILALTFTNKAAREMKERIYNLVGNTDAMNVWMGTFHSIFAKILRFEGYRLGYSQNYTIYDENDSKSLMRSIIRERGLDDKTYKFSYILNRISSAKNNLLSPEDYANNMEIMMQDKGARMPEIANLFSIYNKRCFKASAMDFDDLLFNMNVLLRDFPDVLYKYQHKFEYILVDEYQDTNYAQYLIIKKLAANNENICVVGDDAQSIYSFRGANIENILNFRKDYSDAKVFKLEQNYRSTQNIVNAANSIIIKNKKQIFKEIWTENAEGSLINLIKATTDSEEATLVAHSIFETKMNNQLQNNAFAILYRTNAQSRSLEESLRKLNIPYRIYGGLSFYRRKEIKDLIAYFRLAINHNDDEALLRIINYPARGIGKSTTEKLIVVANEAEKNITEVISNISEYKTELGSGVINKLQSFITMIKSFTAQLKTKDAFTLAKLIAFSSGIMKDLTDDKTTEGVSKLENIEELLNAIKEFTENESYSVDADLMESPDSEQSPNSEIITPNSELPTPNSFRTLDIFLQDVSLLTDADKDDKEDNNKVLMMTVHQAKGLEFPYVYVTGLEENLFPSMMSMNSRDDIEEERRLFYVAVTRAQQKVTLSYSQNRYKWGNMTYCEPSRFIDEIDSRYIEIPVRKSIYNNDNAFEEPTSTYKAKNTKSGIRNPKSTTPQSILSTPKNLKKLKDVTSDDDGGYVNSDTLNLSEGMEVEHLRFGRGKIIGVEGKDANKKATVLFNNIGKKQLLLKFAKLKVV